MPLGRTSSRVNRLPISDCYQGLKLTDGMRTSAYMTTNPAERIEAALARIEVAGTAKTFALERLQARHAKLRNRIEEAVSSLDVLIAQESASEALEDTPNSESEADQI